MTLSCDGGPGCGTVFEVSPDGNGNWTESVLHNFKNNSTDGTYPLANLLTDSSGNLYGTTAHGGSYDGPCVPYGCGTAFEVSPKQGGWQETVLYAFVGNGVDGSNPSGNIIFDSSGDIYGAVFYGGVHGKGAVFELLRQGGGNWTEKIRHNFGSGPHDGHYPNSVVPDPLGSLYGTTMNGGTYDGGTIFELMP